MKISRVFWVSLLAGLALCGVGAAVYLLITEQRYEAALIAAVLLLGIAQLVAAANRTSEITVRREDVDALRKSQDSALHDAAGLRTRIDALEKKIETPPRGGRSGLIAEMKKVRRDQHDLSSHTLGPPVKAADLPPSPRPATPLRSEQLDLYLEPIIATETGTTAHYRAALSLQPGSNPPVAADDLYQQADRGGLRPALDVFALTRVIPVIRRLCAKGRRTSIFIPLGKPTLAAAPYLDEMIKLLGNAPDVARNLVLEIEHGSIAKLSDTGIQGLARLAQSGASLGLGNASATGIEFAALRNLGFRTIEFQAGPAGTVPAWLNAARIASSQGMDVLVGGIEKAEQEDTVRRWARYVSGPHFAAPRLVRSDLGAEPLKARAA